MSLLMDALKKAEEEKTKQAATALAAASKEGAVAATAEMPKTPETLSDHIALSGSENLSDALHDLSLMPEEFIDPLPAPKQSPFAETAALPPLREYSPPPPAGGMLKSADSERARQMANNILFDGNKSSAIRVRKGFIPIVGVVLLCSFALGFYVWKETRVKNSWEVAVSAPAVARTNFAEALPTAKPTTLSAENKEVAVGSPGAYMTSKESPPLTAGTAALTKKDDAQKRDVLATQKENQSEKLQGGVPVASLKPLSARDSRPNSRLRAGKDGAPNVAVTSKTSDLQMGNLALQNGDLEGAASWFEKAQNRANEEIPALFGLATVDLRRNQPNLAAQRYLRILELDPHNSTSEAALLSLQNGMNVDEAIERLQNILRKTPNQPLPNFVLGNFYARQSQWSNAQQAYFNAFQQDAGNPDYLYNLAVSLDHLRQFDLARQYYQQALNARQVRAARFAPDFVEKRLLALSR